MAVKIRYGATPVGRYLRERYGFEFAAQVPEGLLEMTTHIVTAADDLRRERENLAKAIYRLREDFKLMDIGFDQGTAIWHPIGEAASDIHPYTWARRIEQQEDRLVGLLIVYKNLLKAATEATTQSA